MPRLARGLLWLSILVIAALAVGSWLSGGIVYDMLRSDWDAAHKITRLRDYFAGWGLWAPLVFVGFVTVEVLVAPLPGLILYVPGGLIFGAVLGGTLSLLGNMVGAGLACALVRSLRRGDSSWLFAGSGGQRLEQQLQARGGWLIFWLRLNPLTSTDLVSYAAGLTPIPVRQVVLATGLGIAPLCFAQATLSDSLFRAFPQLIYPLMALCAAYLIAAVVLLRRALAASGREG